MFRVVNAEALQKFIDANRSDRSAKAALQRWRTIVSSSDWRNFAELRRTFPHADKVGNAVVFDVGGNKYRVIAAVNFQRQFVYVKVVLAHADYDKDNWK
jgi:mRNA interferase HigB